MNGSAWKPCDLRGPYPAAVSEELYRRIGAALASQIDPGETAVVGGDFRTSTPSLKAALIQGAAAAGARVIDCGQAPTPVLYFHAARRRAAALFVVTASHNPAGDNGLKWMVRGRPPLPADIAELRASVQAGICRSAPGQVDSADPVPEYRAWIESRWQGLGGAFGGREIAIDPGNGAWSRLAPDILRALGFRLHCLHGEPDGRFPNRPADCARTANLSALRQAVRERGAALGVAWDGDGDRAAFIDERGSHASADEVSILFARAVLSAASPGQAAVCDIKLSDAVRREVARLGGMPLLERSGHSFMRRRLLESGAILGLDACGHYFFREAGSRDDGLYSALFLISMMARGGPLAAMRESAGPLYGTPELRIPAALLDYPEVAARLRAAFPGAGEVAVDGARLMLEDGIVLARESSTEPVVSLRIEAFSEGGYRAIVERCLESLGEARALLESQIDAQLPVER